MYSSNTAQATTLVPATGRRKMKQNLAYMRGLMSLHDKTGSYHANCVRQVFIHGVNGEWNTFID